MRRLRTLLLRLLDPIRRQTRERELGAELEAHLQLHIDDNLRAGMSPEDARRVALIRLGGLGPVKDRYRDQRGLPVVDTVVQDVRYGLRLLRRSPGFSAIVGASLALGIGANAAMFSILNAVLLRSLPVHAPQQLAIVAESAQSDSWTYPIWEQIRERQHLFAGAVAWSTGRLSAFEAGQTASVKGVFVSGEFFEVLGTPARIGRMFTSEDDRRGGGADGPVVVLSYQYWQIHFAGSATAIGKSITLEGVPFTVIGVTPPGFFGANVGQTFDVAVPFGTAPLLRGRESRLDRRATWWVTIMVRLKPEQSLTEGIATLQGVQAQIREATLPPEFRPEDLKSYLGRPLILNPAPNGASYLRHRYQGPLTILMAVVVLVLLIACANIANLLLARANTRRHEFSVRLALGASRLRICRQLLVESLVLAFCGAVLGLVLAKWSSAALVGLLSTTTTPVFLDLSLDWRVLGFTTAVVTATALLFGIAPAFQATRAAPADALKEQGRSVVADGRAAIGSLLVVVQVALSLVLVVGAGLFVGTLGKLGNLPLGFDPDRILLIAVAVRGDDVAPNQRAAFFERLRAAAAEVPGVTSATVSVVSPVSGDSWGFRLDPSVHSGLSTASDQSVRVNIVGPEFFQTYGTRVVAGREFTRADTGAAPPVVIVNETFARKVFGAGSPLGLTVRPLGRPGHPGIAREVVGYVADAVYRNLREPVPPTMYIPLPQQEELPPSIDVSVRVHSGSPALLAAPVGAALSRAAPAASTTIRPLAEQVRNSLLQERLLASLSAFFGALGLLLAGLGLYGLTSFTVTCRRTEMGIRMALGATPREVIRLVLTRVAWLVLAGVVAGAAAALWGARLVASLLYGMQPSDPATLVGAMAMLGAIGILAGWVPARRAARTDPARVLHDA